MMLLICIALSWSTKAQRYLANLVISRNDPVGSEYTTFLSPMIGFIDNLKGEFYTFPSSNG